MRITKIIISTHHDYMHRITHHNSISLYVCQALFHTKKYGRNILLSRDGDFLLDEFRLQVFIRKEIVCRK